MRARRNASLAFVLSLLLFWAVLPVFVRAQGSDGHLAVSTDYELLGTSDLRGGGHVTWSLTGEKAADLRLKILNLFDTYPLIPRGFPSEGAVTNGDRDQRLDATEGVAYTNLLESRLEAASRGTVAQYMRLYPFDLREQAGGTEAASFIRSTSGLANTTAATNEDVEIRFLFQANITTMDGRVPLATRALVDSLYDGFSYRAAQSPSLAPSGPYPGSWPFLPGDGWHIVNATGMPPFWDGRPAYWAGNDATGGYDNDVNASTYTSMDPLWSSTLPSYLPFDFRYASRGWATFNYTGTLGLNDSLRLEYANPPYANWKSLPFSTRADLPPSPGLWSNVTVDLSSLRGQVAQLRFRFVSDDTGVPSDIYVRDFALEAPASYVGEVVESDLHYLIGTLSFSQPDVGAGGIHLVRTPAGELLIYETRWSGSPPANDTIYFRTLDIPENPQVLFGVMLIAAYGISRMQGSAYEAYREAHAAAYRPAVHRAKWLHRSGKVAIGVLILFYFVPTVFWVIGLRILVGGIVYGLLAATLVLLLGVGSRAYYRRHLERALPASGEAQGPLVRKVVLPPPAPTETFAARTVGECTHCLRQIREGDPTYQCTCGASYHRSCATSLIRCSNCRTPIAPTVLRARKQVSLRCDSCGEAQTVLEGIDPRAAVCPSCGELLRHMDEGKRYLTVTGNPAITFIWMRNLAEGKPALCLTPASPERIRLEFGVKNVSIVQVSSTAAGAIDPAKLDPLGLRSMLPLAREGKGGVILYDGIDEVIAEASLEDVIHFLRKANDLAFVHGVTVIARLAPGRLTEDEVKQLNKEFDEYLDLSSQL